jgi:hypothetical protein
MRDNEMVRTKIQAKIQKILKILLIAIVATTVFGFVVKALWNWLMPSLFAWHAITFWQAIGLLVLCKLLFGGFRGGPGRGMHWRRNMGQRWAQMSEEERDKFKRCFGGRFGQYGNRPGDMEHPEFKEAQ